MGEGWTIGDYRFLIVSFSPDPQTNLYVQFWSEPLEPVAVEVCSGEWNPGALRYVRQRQRTVLEGLGYAKGGRAKNFRREIQIDSAEQADTVAREVLPIYFDAFRYRGQWPLEVEWCHEPPPTLRTLSDPLPLLRIVPHGRRELRVSMPLRLDGGVTVTWLLNGLAHWGESWKACERASSALRRP